MTSRKVVRQSFTATLLQFSVYLSSHLSWMREDVVVHVLHVFMRFLLLAKQSKTTSHCMVMINYRKRSPHLLGL
jgi:hypothetical protein